MWEDSKQREIPKETWQRNNNNNNNTYESWHNFINQQAFFFILFMSSLQKLLWSHICPINMREPST